MLQYALSLKLLLAVNLQRFELIVNEKEMIAKLQYTTHYSSLLKACKEDLLNLIWAIYNPCL